MATAADVIELAFRRLGIKAEGEDLTADQAAYADAVMRSVWAEINTTAPVGWWPDDVPADALVPLANLLAAEIGPSYGVPSEPRGQAMIRLLAVIRLDNRTDKPTDPQYF
jgi:hypothetical protein